MGLGGSVAAHISAGSLLMLGSNGRHSEVGMRRSGPATYFVPKGPITAASMLGKPRRCSLTSKTRLEGGLQPAEAGESLRPDNPELP